MSTPGMTRSIRHGSFQAVGVPPRTEAVRMPRLLVHHRHEPFYVAQRATATRVSEVDIP